VTTVRTQAELDAALAADDGSICIDSPEGVWLRLTGSAHVVAWGSAHVVARDSAHVVARGSAHVEAWGSAHVVARDSAHVVAWDSAHVVARGSAHVVARGSAHVVAWGSAHVVARDSAHVVARGSAHVEATPYVAVHLHSQHVRLSGGTVIDLTSLNAENTETWLTYNGLTTDGDGAVVLYKAVNDDLTSEHALPDGTHATYQPGTTLAAPDWRGDHECGGGLHLSPTPLHALDYHRRAIRFVACRVRVADLRTIGWDKAKVPACAVLHEVDRYSRVLAAAVAS
jgi:hypothetical protein